MEQNSSINKDNRIEYIDYIKAFACFLVVLGHLIQSLQKSGIDQYRNITTFINWFIYLFHMPLFMCMSGFLYTKNKKRFTWSEYRKFEIKKIINLIIPYITFYLLSVFINMMMAKSVNTVRGVKDILNMFNNPIAPYWFLYALLSIFIVIPIMERICKDKYTIVFSILVVMKIIGIFIHTNIYFIDSIMNYAIYFYLGCFFNKRKNINKNIINVILAILYICICITIYFIKDSINMYVYKLIAVVLAVIGIYVLVSIFIKVSHSRVLDTFKRYTFQVFLTHTIFAAGARILLLKIGIKNYFIQFVIGMVVSIYVPVLVSIISNKIVYTDFVFYPTKTIEKIKGRNMKNAN